LVQSIEVIERNYQFHQLNDGEQFYGSKLNRAFLTYHELGIVKCELGKYNESKFHFMKAWEILNKHKTEFETNDDLVYRNQELLKDFGRDHTLRGNLERGLDLLKKSLLIIETKMSNRLFLVVNLLYHISWNLSITGKLHEALSFINRAVKILDQNEGNFTRDFSYIRSHQRYVAELQNRDVSPLPLLHRYRFRWTLTPSGYLDDEVTSQATLLLDDILSIC